MRKDYWAVKGDLQGNKGLWMWHCGGLSVWFEEKGDVCGPCLLPIIINIGVDHHIK